MPSKVSTENLTSYDLLKSLALLLMVIDHTGFFFFPGNEWFRVLGRASMPIWLFLIGYARSRDLSNPLFIGAGLLIVANFILGGSVFPLNILVTIIVVRIILDPVASIVFRNWEAAIYGAFALSVLTVFTFLMFEYGVCALLIALCGYAFRNVETVSLSLRAKKIFFGYSLGFYAFFQMLIFQMPKLESQIMVMLIAATGLLLYHFRGREVTETEEKLPQPAVSALKIGGRYTLEFYVAHLILFKLAACLLGLAAYGWFAWDWVR